MAQKATDTAKRFLGVSETGPAVRPQLRYGLLAFGVVLLTGNAIVGRLTWGVLASAATAGAVACVVGLMRRADR